MRFESVTVPAAVKPNRSNDYGFMKYLPLWCHSAMGRLHKTGTSQKTCHKRPIFKAFGKKSAESKSDSILNFLQAPDIGLMISKIVYLWKIAS